MGWLRRHKVLVIAVIAIVGAAAVGRGFYLHSTTGKVNQLLDELRPCNTPAWWANFMEKYRLDDQSHETPGSIEDSLVAIGKPAVPALIRALNDPDREVALVAATALARIGDDRAIDPLLNYLECRFEPCCDAPSPTVLAVAKSNSPAMVTRMIELLNDPQHADYAAAVLMHMGSVAAKPLADALNAAPRKANDHPQDSGISKLALRLVPSAASGSHNSAKGCGTGHRRFRWRHNDAGSKVTDAIKTYGLHDVKDLGSRNTEFRLFETRTGGFGRRNIPARP